MGSKVPPPYFGIPPKVYDPKYFHELTRTFAQFIGIMSNPGEGRFTFAVFTDLQDNNQNLSEGAVFEHDGAVMITKPNAPHPAGVVLSSVAGNVSVVTS